MAPKRTRAAAAHKNIKSATDDDEVELPTTKDLLKQLAATPTKALPANLRKLLKKSSDDDEEDYAANGGDNFDEEEDDDDDEDIIVPKKKRSVKKVKAYHETTPAPVGEKGVLDCMWRPWTLHISKNEYEIMATKWVSLL